MADWLHPVVPRIVSDVLPDAGQVGARGPLRVRCDNAGVPHTTTVADFPSPDSADPDYVCGTAEYDYDAWVECLNLFLQKGSALNEAKWCLSRCCRALDGICIEQGVPINARFVNGFE